jgi:cell division protein FtsW
MLLGAVVFLVCLGLLMVYSVSSARAVIEGSDPASLVRKQIMYALLGFGVLGLIARMHVDAFRRLAPMAVGTAIVSLMAVIALPTSGLPIHSVFVNGAKRWLAIGPVQIQPSELAKMALILWIAMAVARDPKRLSQPRGLVPFIALTGLLAALIVIEPDLGTTGTLVVTAFAMVFVAGAPVGKLGAIGGIVGGLVVLVIMSSPYQRARVVSFLNPWADPTGDGFQSVQGQIAIGSGGIFGRGLGNSIQKNFFLPEAQTDFIGAIIGEELGLIGLCAMIAAFVVLGVAGYRIAMRSRNLHQRLLAAGITSLICVQAGINLGQVFGLLPVTGVPLPLVSAGGTSIVVFLAGVGVLVNISRQGKKAHARRAAVASDSSGDRRRRNGGSRQTGTGDRGRIAS